jgi:hypothetical protein
VRNINAPRLGRYNELCPTGFGNSEPIEIVNFGRRNARRFNHGSKNRGMGVLRCTNGGNLWSSVTSGAVALNLGFPYRELITLERESLGQRVERDQG